MYSSKKINSEKEQNLIREIEEIILREEIKLEHNFEEIIAGLLELPDVKGSDFVSLVQQHFLKFMGRIL